LGTNPLMTAFTVDSFEGMSMDAMGGAMAQMNGGACTTGYATCLPPNFAGAITNTFDSLMHKAILEQDLVKYLLLQRES
jgi:hypothetical protein